MTVDLSLFYFPSAIALGALHALEPGHAKTLTAAYLIGTKGTVRDATILGLSVAATHSFVVIGLAVTAVILGRETFTDSASFYLAIGSSLIVIILGIWLLQKRLRALRRANHLRNHHHEHHHDHVHAHEHQDHALLSDEEHSTLHAAQLPDYAQRGERPTVAQIIGFGAAGGLVPCPAAVSVMLLALSLNNTGKGLFLVLGFGLGLALTLVGIGLLIVTGLTKLSSHGRLSRIGSIAPTLAAAMVIVSGGIGLISAYFHS